jgi:hypothetical protein
MAKKDGGQPAASKAERARPAHECRIGRIRATIWQNHHETQGTWYSITLSRSYKDGEGQWKSASSFGRDDLLVVGEVTRMAFHWIHRQYQEKTNGAAGQKESGEDAPTDAIDIPF